ncbi:DUF4407 domain-containing protein [Frankia sp. AiPa1]|uniref:DUF4407 domain-containing protein n=1 Tax=Frankia sp. AiPa1 TaxID=573492 RepID=UPI00202B348F|nr:DUF4407 domain-containing protein [Frankia sp. AiPa1]
MTQLQQAPPDRHHDLHNDRRANGDRSSHSDRHDDHYRGDDDFRGNGDHRHDDDRWGDRRRDGRDDGASRWPGGSLPDEVPDLTSELTGTWRATPAAGASGQAGSGVDHDAATEIPSGLGFDDRSGHGAAGDPAGGATQAGEGTGGAHPPAAGARPSDGQAGDAASDRRHRRRRSRRSRARRSTPQPSLWSPSAMLLRLGGIDPALINNSVDRTRYVTAALAMLLYGTFATAGFTIFLMIATGGGIWPWVLGGMLVAAAIMLYDRMLLSYVNINLAGLEDSTAAPLGPTRATGYIVRIIIALVTAAVVTHPLTLKMFQHEIDGALTRVRSVQLQNSIDAVNAERQQRKNDLGTHIQTDRDQLDTANTDVNTTGAAVERERSGQGPTGQVGCGDECGRLLVAYNAAVARQSAANTQLTNDLAQKAASERTIDGEQDGKIRDLKAHPPQVGGVLNQESALWQVLLHSKAAMVRYLLVVVLFILLDIAVLLVKLSSRNSPYELLMARRVRRVLRTDGSVSVRDEDVERDRLLRNLENRDKKDVRRAERVDAEDEARHLTRFHESEAERRGLVDKAALRAAEDQLAFQTRHRQLTSDAAVAMLLIDLENTRKVAEAQRAHEQAMAALGIPIPPRGPTGPTGQMPPRTPPPRADLVPGEILGSRWLLKERNLPRGERAQAPSEIWLGRDITGRHKGDVVVKTTVVPDDANARRARERALADMQVGEHKYVVKILDSGDQQNLLWMVMPYYALGSLARYMPNEVPVRPLRQVLAVVDHVLEALESQPRRAHGDIKATNIVVEDTVERQVDDLPVFIDLRIRVIDWAVSKLWTVMAAQLAPTVTGSMLWRSPEQRVSRRPDPRSDLYSVGCLLYWLVSGMLPFENEVSPFTETEVEAVQSRGQPPEALDNLVPGTPVSVGRFATQLLSYRAEDRMPGVPNGEVLAAARDRVGAIAEEVAQLIRYTAGEIMVGAAPTSDEGDDDYTDGGVWGAHRHAPTGRTMSEDDRPERG